MAGGRFVRSHMACNYRVKINRNRPTAPTLLLNAIIIRSTLLRTRRPHSAKLAFIYTQWDRP